MADFEFQVLRKCRSELNERRLEHMLTYSSVQMMPNLKIQFSTISLLFPKSFGLKVCFAVYFPKDPIFNNFPTLYEEFWVEGFAVWCIALREGIFQVIELASGSVFFTR